MNTFFHTPNPIDPQILRYVGQIGDEFYVDLYYPRSPESKTKFIHVGLVDTRAADGIRISYDFERDGWKIEQDAHHQQDCNSPICNPEWKEVAFIVAWGSQVDAEDSE